MSVQINLNTEGKSEVDSIEDGEEFTTVAHTEFDGLFRCYEPGREDYEFVALSEDYVETIESSQSKRIAPDIVVYGDHSAWGDTPSSFYSG